MGLAREAVALYLKGREKAISYYRLSHLKYTAAMSAGSSYTNSQDLVDTSTEGFKDILYNKESVKPEEVRSPEDVRDLWEQVIGKPWPVSSSGKDDEPEEGTTED
jgi:hypothetical protein